MDKDAGCIREISRRVRLSKSTVAKALHNCGNVDVGTKEAILRAAREVQYDPAGARRAKIQAGETVVGVVLPINPYAFWNEAIRGVKDAMVTQTGCIGVCRLEPMVEVYMPGQEKVTYVKMTPEKVARVVSEHLVGGHPVTEYTIGNVR